MKKLILIILVCFASFSCIKQDDIRIHGLEKISVESESRAKADFKIENKSSSKVTIMDINLAIKVNQKEFIKLTLTDKLIIKRKSNDIVTADLAYKFNNPLALLSFIGGKSSYTKLLSQMTFSGNLKAKVGLATKNLEYKDTSLEQLLRSLDIEPSEFIKNLDL